ncbi:DUF1996 domain-containing protein [Streptomyces sp. 549]|uniref:DUF1996 domain-containing protein n=1 Tax=Streptomyces sp. 549 TaxID=3049076 RepID=UPI0024C257AF|nr:DUF1996 domain-containing protein [Streptomyces sp. 549]MDK1473316.1 DUF1996 domain-containing protein [Streptomyces sp. 549]
MSRKLSDRRGQGHKRSRKGVRTLALVAALAVGGGGTAIVAANASAGNHSPAPRTAAQPSTGPAQVAAKGPRTINCPDAGERLRDVPEASKRAVAAHLARLDAQVAAAYHRLAKGRSSERAVLAKLKRSRSHSLDRINRAITRAGGQAPELRSLRVCTVKKKWPLPDSTRPAAQPTLPAPPDGAPPQGGPVPEDFVDITSVQPVAAGPAPGGNASTGTFVSRCGTNERGHFNSDNVIVAPGVSNGAHHVHDYVGNVSTDAFSTEESLAAAETTCTNGDRSSHYWPVLRSLSEGDAGAQARGPGADEPGNAPDGNVGRILQPAEVSLTFRGSPVSKVTAMPRFLRIITGDAKAFTNGTANANASWSCTGFEDRQLTDRYPICPQGSKVVRTFAFQSCWDGRNTDSANHRTHVSFAGPDGNCGPGFTAIPQLVQRIVYDIPPGTAFALDSFPEQLHKPVTDHGDFVNVMDDRLMRKAVKCINSGRNCG